MLYERVLGHGTALIHPQVAALHCGDDNVAAAGWMRIQRGSGWLCRLAATFLRLPRAGDRVPVELLITRQGDGERWVRRFGGDRTIHSRQTAGTHAGELEERFGLVRLVFALEPAGDQLRFRQQRCELRAGWLRLRLPRPLAPRVEAVARPASGHGLAVSVRAGLGPLSLLLAYQGVVDIRRTCDANRVVAAGPARAHRGL